MNDTDLILAFDASTQVTVVALGTAGGALLGHRELPAMPGKSNQASAHLIPTIEALATETGTAMADIRLVATGRGPGTFTGSRVAVATAKGLAFGLGVRALGVSTLACIAASLPEAATTEGEIQRVVGLLDARRGEVYCAVFEWPSLVPMGPQCCVPPTSLIAALGVDIQGPDVFALGTGIAPAREILVAAGTSMIATIGPSAQGLWRATVAALGRDEMGQPDELSVDYLRETYAQMGLNPPKRTPYRSPFV